MVRRVMRKSRMVRITKAQVRIVFFVCFVLLPLLAPLLIAAYTSRSKRAPFHAQLHLWRNNDILRSSLVDICQLQTHFHVIRSKDSLFQTIPQWLLVSLTFLLKLTFSNKQVLYQLYRLFVMDTRLAFLETPKFGRSVFSCFKTTHYGFSYSMLEKYRASACASPSVFSVRSSFLYPPSPGNRTWT